jgi:hypothetical protein
LRAKNRGIALAKFDPYRDEIDVNEVPAPLRDLIPFSFKWGIGDDVARSDFEEAVSDEEKDQFRRALTGRTAQVAEWLDSFSEDSVHPRCLLQFHLHA